MSTGWSSEWLDFAYMDLSAAEHLLTMRPLPVEIICYHCEQAAEKFLKATLVQFDREPPKTHDLTLQVSVWRILQRKSRRWAVQRGTALNNGS